MISLFGLTFYINRNFSNLKTIAFSHLILNNSPSELITFIKKIKITQTDINKIINNYEQCKPYRIFSMFSTQCDSTKQLLNVLNEITISNISDEMKNNNFSTAICEYLENFNSVGIKNTDKGSSLHCIIVEYFNFLIFLNIAKERGLISSEELAKASQVSTHV